MQPQLQTNANANSKLLRSPAYYEKLLPKAADGGAELCCQLQDSTKIQLAGPPPELQALDYNATYKHKSGKLLSCAHVLSAPRSLSLPREVPIMRLTSTSLVDVSVVLL
jgi:hypothetical protein